MAKFKAGDVIVGNTGGYFEVVCVGVECYFLRIEDKEYLLLHKEIDNNYVIKPKKKKKLWQWLIKVGNIYTSTTIFYENKEDVMCTHYSEYTVIKRLDHTEIEVDDE